MRPLCLPVLLRREAKNRSLVSADGWSETNRKTREMAKMDSYTEMHHLQQRRNELRTIVANLEDIKDWIAKNTADMQSGLLECVTGLESAIEQIDSVKGLIDDKATEMEEQVYSENAT